MELISYLPADSVLRRLNSRHEIAGTVARQFAAARIFSIDYGTDPTAEAAAYEGTRELCRRVVAVYRANARTLSAVAERLIDQNPTARANLNNVLSAGQSLAATPTPTPYPSISDGFAGHMLTSLSRDIEWLRRRLEFPPETGFDSFAELHSFRTTVTSVVFSLCHFSWPGPAASPEVAYQCARAIVIPFVPIDSPIDLLKMPRYVSVEVQESLQWQVTKVALRAASEGIPVDRVRERLSYDRVPQPLINSMLPR